MTAPWDVRELLIEGLRAEAAESDWLERHEGALSLSQVGRCWRKERLRLLGNEEAKPSDRSLRRMRLGNIVEDDLYKRAVKANRRPKRWAEVELQIGDILFRGTPDLIFTEGILEVKTTGYETMAEPLPWPHLVQLGGYMVALKRPGQLIYIGKMGAMEWQFDFTSVPEGVEEYLRDAAAFFTEHGDDDPEFYPASRDQCGICGYEAICPRDADADERVEVELDEAQQRLVDRFLKAKEQSTMWQREEKDAKGRVLGLREVYAADEKGRTRLSTPTHALTVTTRTQAATDWDAIKAAGIQLPKHQITFPVIRVTEKETADGKTTE